MTNISDYNPSYGFITQVYPPSFLPENVSITPATTTDQSKSTSSDAQTTRFTAEVSNPRDLFTPSNLAKFNCEWENKVPTAFFRGTATGGGTTVDTNQRLKCAQLSYEWNSNPLLNGTSTTEESSDSSSDSNNGGNASIAASTTNNKPYLDAKITGWNRRDKKLASSKMTFIRPKQFKFDGGKQNYIEIYKQSSYKYLVYIEGHCAACRYGFMMLLGSVILKVDSTCVADQMWYFPLLQPYVDHVPVKADFSDLKEQIEWCRNNDDQCQIIAKNAQNLYYQYICKDGILDYMQSIFYEISSRYYVPPDYASYAPKKEKIPNISSFCNENCSTLFNDICIMCRQGKALKQEKEKKTVEKLNAIKEKRELKRLKDIEEIKLKRLKGLPLQSQFN